MFFWKEVKTHGVLAKVSMLHDLDFNHLPFINMN